MKLSRRQFARAASAAVGVALLPRHARAQESPPPTGSAPPPPRLAAASQAEADARLQLVVARWGARLSAGDRATVAKLCTDLQGTLEAVRAYALDVTDEPAPIFHAARRKH